MYIIFVACNGCFKNLKEISCRSIYKSNKLSFCLFVYFVYLLVCHVREQEVHWEAWLW